MIPEIYLSSPHLGDLELQYVQEAFAANWIAPVGPHIDAFERELCIETGAAHAAALSSGTSALHLSLVLLGVGPGDEVICQSFTFAASANPIVYQGATPVFIDSEADTWNMCPDALEMALKDRLARGKRPKAVIAVHLYGMPAKLDALLKICHHYEVPLVEDAAESFGSTYKNKPCGSFGKLAVLSFNGNKIITTSGGGALLSDDEALIKRARFLATQARDPAPYYQHSSIGYNYRISNVCAGIGRGQLRILADRVAQRRANYAYYFEHLSKLPGFAFQPEPNPCFSNRWLTCITLDPDLSGGITCEDIRLALAERRIEARPLWKPMHQQPVFAGLPFYGSGVSDRLFKTGLCLPSGSNLTREQIIKVVSCIEETVEVAYLADGKN
ncbi:DegT/DnrJ/EryC1/StrS family aminotransferase [Larkinella humicola]|uniref:GDP-perosamine synthase n=1 Tax=Larkinella humicola TaxID=2607654 RepID=A0A5N1JD24_9BACT|nr:aminotransferase class I/II-fold pyridoxal phosphate-dependent enzyme [Larkinella humicola]KAA9349704.1 aminotransferase class I/II-fold pyridoxal phosphate-dependent enzyme [Larkinella humicola]